jgi:hypothetical protein
MQDKVAAHHHPLTVPSNPSHPIPPYPEAGQFHPSIHLINQSVNQPIHSILAPHLIGHPFPFLVLVFLGSAYGLSK